MIASAKAISAGGVGLVYLCDTFPGLDADHIRVAVRPAPQVAVLVGALRAALDCRKATFTQSDGVNVAFLQREVRA